MKDPIEVDESHGLSDMFLIQKESYLRILKNKNSFSIVKKSSRYKLCT